MRTHASPSRRRFIGKMASLVTTAMAAHLLPPSLQAALSTAEETTDTMHYRPLNGRCLREIALRRMHHGKDAFRNPFGFGRNKRFLQVLSWKLLHRNAYEQHLGDQPTTSVAIDWKPVKAHAGVSVTLIRHASLLIRDGGKTLIVDPVFGDIFWFVKYFSPLVSPLDEMPRPDHVLITHGHYDHLDMGSLGALDPRSHVISPLGYEAEFSDLGMNRRSRLDWYQTYAEEGLEITLLPANHWTMRNPLVGPNRSLWGGYLIRTAGGPVIYVAGDSAYFDGFEQLGADYDIDLAIFNMGAYAPRWFMAPSHMNPEETVRAFVELGARNLSIAHWGTFRLGDEPVHFPPRDLEAELAKRGLSSRQVPLALGQTHFF